ncbi:MAG TPA: molybdopterin-dependent oxidoreductase [Thermodesulfobacteriota bacterium]|nr:molybdopterin-dependent oxidoreductase [Thermodesulfobacteriota bacterium]
MATTTQTVKLTIDGTVVEVSKGTTILEAAQSVGIGIPTLCHDRRLIPFGACRLCVVQQKGKSELLPSCFTPAKEGMEIITHSPEITESRRLQLQFILLNHPMTCPRCEKEGECELQRLVYEYGVEETLYPWERISSPADDRSPLLQRDSDKCILCGRCVRICDEVQGVGELSFSRRGIKTVIDTDFHRPLQCEFCGQCMDTCPVGAITSNRFDYMAKVWELKETTTPCPYCACGCSLTIAAKNGEIKRVFSDPDKGPSDGNLCVKGRFGWDFVDHPERIKTPLLRVNGTIKEASWEEALRYVAQKLETIKDQNGPEAIAGMVSSRLTNEEYYLLKKLFRDAIGTNRIAQRGEESSRGLTEGLGKTLGRAASTNSIQEIRHADCLLVIGVDPAQTHPIVKNEIQLAVRRNRAQLIVLGSYGTSLTRATSISPLLPSAITLLDQPGRETYLLNAIIQTVLKEGLENKNFIDERTDGIEELRKQVSANQPEFSEKAEEIKDEIEKAARAFAQAKKSMILIGSGLWSHLDAEKIAIASSNLALITGHIGRESCGILILLEKSNDQGAVDMGFPLEKKEKGSEDLLRIALEGKLKALYLIGEDPSASSSFGKQALGKIPLLIVQDLFMTETAGMAHVVLPACAFVEKGGTLTSLERRVQKLNPLRSPLGQSKSDFDIFLALLRLLEAPIPGETPEAVFEEIRRVLPYYQGVQEGEQWPDGSPYLYADGFPMGKAKLIPVRGGTAGQNPEAYPFRLTQRPSLFQSGLLSSKSDALRTVSEKPYLEMNLEDAQRLRIEQGELAQLSTPQGRSLQIEVKYSSNLVSGVVTSSYPCSLIEEEGTASVKVTRLRKN